MPRGVAPSLHLKYWLDDSPQFMLLGGWAGTGVMALMAQLMPISDPGNVPFYVAIASVLVGQGAWSWITGFLMHIL